MTASESPDPAAKSNRTIVHVDMDAFYAAVEELDHPEYRGQPLIIGADPKGGQGRGVVSTCNYIARKFGVHSAQPVSQAYRLCPQGIFIPPAYARYSELSKAIMKILQSFSPTVEQVSIDEAFLDCTGTERLFGQAPELGQRIKDTIRAETGLTASVGIAPNKYIAKVASDLEKPDGLTICAPGREREFLGRLPVERLWGAGKKTVLKLKTCGYWQIGDLAKAELGEVRKALGNHGEHFWRLAKGLDDRPVRTGWRRKSISEETTFEHDVDDNDRLEQVLYKIAETLTRNLRREDARGRTVVLKIRLTGFETFTRSKTVPEPTDETKTIRETALQMFRAFDRRGKAVRLIGIGVSNLLFADDPDPVQKKAARISQMDLFGDLSQSSGQDSGEHSAGHPGDKRDRSERRRDELLDDLKDKFGNHIKRGSLL
ncbi:MAG: DNA polymerase IV [bacterium]|nr:DNA polymerase IV [bacterium]